MGEQKTVAIAPSDPPPRAPVPPLEASYAHPALKYGAPSPGIGSQRLRLFDGFVAAFDSRTRNPNWVLEHLSFHEDLKNDVDRSKSLFVEDSLIEERFRTKLTDFENSGYDRGHMAPAANHKQSQKAMDDTFTLTYNPAHTYTNFFWFCRNICPQVGDGFNRDYWARFEKFVRRLVKVSTAVYVATGPLWLPERESEGKYIMKYPMIGKPPALISVPTHFYKVILAEPSDIDNGATNGSINGATNGVSSEASNDCAVAAFVMPNRSIGPDVPLTRFAVPITDLESATGLKFFPKYMTDVRRERLDRAALVWRSIGQALYGQTTAPMLDTLDGMESQSKKATPAETNASKIAPKSSQSIMSEEKKCSLEPHLCYHTECTLPPPEFWKKTSQKESEKRKS